MIVQELIIGGAGLITTTISSWVTWILAKKKFDTEVDHSMIHNMEKSLEFYTKLADDNSARLDSVMKENIELRSELQELRKQILDLSLNICMNLTCEARMREETVKKYKRNAKSSSRLDISESPNRGRRKPVNTAGDTDTEE